MPSTARTIYLNAPAQQPTAPGISTSNEQLQWPPKAPLDVLDFTLDCSNFLADAGGDTIVSASVTLACAPADLEFGTLTATTTALTWEFSAGTPGVDYNCSVKFSTAGSLTVERTCVLPVQNL